MCQIPVRSILDAGCGIGLLRKPLRGISAAGALHGSRGERLSVRALRLDAGLGRRFRAAKRRAISWSATTCCNTSTTATAARAIANFARLTRAALYVSALTARGLARELRPQPHRPRGASARRRTGIGAACAALPLSRLRRLAAQGRDRDPLGHGAARAAGSAELSSIQSTSAACTGSPAPIVRARVIDQGDQHVGLAGRRRSRSPRRR